MSTLEERVADAESVIRAHIRLEMAMYDSDLESSWPKDASRLLNDYNEKYGADLASTYDSYYAEEEPDAET